MKKILIALLTVIFCIPIQAAQDKFINALRTCSAYSEKGNVEVDGVTAVSVKEMTGWQGDRCIYKETIKMGEMNINTKCSFTRAQIKEISSVADAYYLTQQYSDEAQDFSSLEATKNNPLAKVLSKYLQDPSVCTMSY